MSAISTTHAGSLPRPGPLAKALRGSAEARLGTAFQSLVDDAVAQVLAMQLDAGLTYLNDGEQGKPSYATYVRDRLDGFDGEPRPSMYNHYASRFPDYVAMVSGGRPPDPQAFSPSCGSPVRLRDPEAVHRDISRLLRAADAAGVGPDRLFLTAASPGIVALFFPNDYYPSDEEYLGAIADAMAPEYRAIVDAGISLQLDCPDLAMARHARRELLELDAFRNEAALRVAALNAATAGLDPARMRLHVCWGNTAAPHVFDVELAAIIDIVASARPSGLVLEASNPRHAHEWHVFEDFDLPDDKYLVPGVIDTTTNFVEHPDLVAERIATYARVVGASRVVAGTDCGFSTGAGTGAVAPSVVAEKLASLTEGARRASKRP